MEGKDQAGETTECGLSVEAAKLRVVPGGNSSIIEGWDGPLINTT